MNDGPQPLIESVERSGSLIVLAALALLAGALAGLLGAVFRLALAQAEHFRDVLIAVAHGYALMGFVLVTALCAVTTSLAAWLVRRFSPYASGSGIPHVEAVLHGKMP